ncbi:hypothetical protein BCR33DRAFT_452268 [Rhizoclosmatium globosum]|uniref:Uncharacterized protein n=1 Tax=Rhizoclosmatium globosum TaxID=329046 RepID=A0A1Y2CWA4_9FUNG|nr:hypothetical protein BCR33DRAFT_452268 [Rhizoclosmatium globosum]|eukprot:ORY51319.1 hypothetical protein BCR33DRAFT_452268 [Rhizoclosmatium globosum]
MSVRPCGNSLKSTDSPYLSYQRKNPSFASQSNEFCVFFFRSMVYSGFSFISNPTDVTNTRPRDWNHQIPPIAKNFTGRDTEQSLIRLSIFLHGISLVIGVPGMGKSTLAAKFAHDNAENYQTVFGFRSKRRKCEYRV